MSTTEQAEVRRRRAGRRLTSVGIPLVSLVAFVAAAAVTGALAATLRSGVGAAPMLAALLALAAGGAFWAGAFGMCAWFRERERLAQRD